MVRFVVNGTERVIDSPSGSTLLPVLRDDLGLTAAKYGCGEGRCGACTVLVDGATERSCVVDVDAIDGATVTTVEGLGSAGDLHPVQSALVDARALQCGYCTPGMVMSAVALLDRDPAADEPAVTDAMNGNICRCGGYPRIVQAIRAAAAATRKPVRSPGSTGGVAVGGEPSATAGRSRPAWTVVLAGLAGGHRSWGWTTPGGARLEIDADGGIRAFVGKVDGGQGNRHSLVRLIAAELGVGTANVRLEMGDTGSAPFDLGTFGSRSTPDAGHAVRVVAVAARRALLAEAATRWELPVERLRIERGRVRDGGSDRTISYGELVASGPRVLEADPDEPLAAAPPGLGAVDDAAVRAALVGAVTGAKAFPSDLSLPGMLHGRVLRPPAHGSALRSADTSAARRSVDVTVVEEDGFVAVVGATREAATRGLRSIRADWSPGAGPTEDQLAGYLRDHPAEDRGWAGAVAHETGDVDSARASADVVLEATYTTAYIAHVPLEPRVALARVDGGTVTVWVGTQRPFTVRADVASRLGIDEERVRVVVPDFGAGFGGKHTADVAVEAARLARATGSPVKVAWTREEEFRHTYFRPAAVIDVRSSAADGRLTSWEFTNINSGPAALFSPYDAANQRVRFQPADSPLPQGSYRALAATANTFARESHIDEIAHALDTDPVELRLRHLADDRLKAVLTEVADRVDWSRRSRHPGEGVGIACGIEKDARVATAAHVHVDASGRLEVRRVVTAFDCGAVVDPDGLRGQIIGATIMGLGGALFEAVHFDAGRILNPTLTDYRVPRFTDVPPIDVVVVDRPDVPSAGGGETPIIAVAPAVANAVHAVTGRRLRSLPLAPHGTVP